MSIKVRITAWITLMVLLLAAMTLVFVLVINHNAITDDPAGRLVNVVQENVKDVEFDRGKFEWDDLSYTAAAFTAMFYSTDGALRTARCRRISIRTWRFPQTSCAQSAAAAGITLSMTAMSTWT